MESFIRPVVIIYMIPTIEPVMDASNNVAHTPTKPIHDPIKASKSTSPSPSPSLCVSLKKIKEIVFRMQYPARVPMMLSDKDSGK